MCNVTRLGVRGLADAHRRESGCKRDRAEAVHVHCSSTLAFELGRDASVRGSSAGYEGKLEWEGAAAPNLAAISSTRWAAAKAPPPPVTSRYARSSTALRLGLFSSAAENGRASASVVVVSRLSTV